MFTNERWLRQHRTGRKRPRKRRGRRRRRRRRKPPGALQSDKAKRTVLEQTQVGASHENNVHVFVGPRQEVRPQTQTPGRGGVRRVSRPFPTEPVPVADPAASRQECEEIQVQQSAHTHVDVPQLVFVAHVHIHIVLESLLVVASPCRGQNVAGAAQIRVSRGRLRASIRF